MTADPTSRSDCNWAPDFYLARAVKFFWCVLPLSFSLAASCLAGRSSDGAIDLSRSILDVPRYEVAVETAYLLGVFGNPHAYEVAPQFITARIRWGVNDSDTWFRGYNQFCLTAEAQPIVRGIENHYFGLNFGFRYNFVRPNSRWVPYFSGGLGLGWIDSNADNFGSQGQDFTFNILSAAGIAYRVSDKWKVSAGVLYEHFSNGGQTDPNPSLNLLGPQLAVSCTF